MKIVYRPVLTGNRRWRKIFPFCTGKILESVPHIAAKGEFDMVDTRGYICPTPVLMVQKALKDRPATVEVLAEAGAAVETCPADVPPAVMQAAGELALRTHRVLGLEVYSRTDMILDKDGNLWVLEANSLPGMTPNSFVPKEAAAVGMSYNQLCEEIVRLSCDVKRRG